MRMAEIGLKKFDQAEERKSAISKDPSDGTGGMEGERLLLDSHRRQVVVLSLFSL
jgi:hypothetical protein